MPRLDTDPVQILNRDKQAAARLVEGVGRARTFELLKRAQLQLARRLTQAEGLNGPGKQSYTANQLRQTLQQVRAVTTGLKVGMKDLTTTQGLHLAQQAAKTAVDYLHASEQKFKGSTHELSLDRARMMDRSVAGAKSSILRRLMSDPKHPAHKGILDRYGDAVVTHFEDTLQTAVVARTPWHEVRQQLIDGSPFLQQAPASWAERIVRTESMNAHGTASHTAIVDAQQQLGDMVKIISSVFDSRTGADSFAVHGQIRRPSESFDSWFGPYMHPPDRPNDRSVVVPHRISWPIPANLKAKSGGDISARWAAEGRKGSPPPQPNITTVPLEQFGKAPPKAEASTPFAPKEPIAAVPRKPEGKPVPRIEPSPMSLLAAIKPAPVNHLHKKISGQAGSNPGGVYEGDDGVQRYVKFYNDPAQAFGEHLAASLYSDLGLGGLNTTTFEHEGKTAFASEMLPDVKTLGSLGDKLTKTVAKKALDGFAADVLTANWDAAGLSLDNMVLDRHGKVRRIDNGASFLTRAQGARKNVGLLEHVTEWDSFFDPKKNSGYAKLARAAGVSSADELSLSIQRSVAKITKLADAPGGWAKYVNDRAAGMSASDRQQVVDMLDARTAFLKKKASELAAKKKPAPLTEPVRHLEDAEFEAGYANYLKKLDHATSFLERHKDLEHLRSYTGSEYTPMNNLLLKRAGPISDHERANIQEGIDRTQKVLQDAKRAGHAIEGAVYRGVAVDKSTLAGWVNSPQIVFENFGSTSVSQEAAEYFTAPKKADHDNRVLFRIRQRSAIPVDMVSKNRGEKEAILPHGSRFRVLKVNQGGKIKIWGDDHPITIIDMEEM